MLSLRDEAVMLAPERPLLLLGRYRGALLAASPSFAAIVGFSGRFSGLSLGFLAARPLKLSCFDYKAPAPS